MEESDFVLSADGISGAAIQPVSGSGSLYSVTVNTGTGDGTIRLDVSDDDTIVDGASNPLGGPGLVNGDYNAGESYTIDKTAPVITRLGNAEVSLEVGSPYNDSGATAMDNDDGDITASIVKLNPVETAVVFDTLRGRWYTFAAFQEADSGEERVHRLPDKRLARVLMYPCYRSRTEKSPSA